MLRITPSCPGPALLACALALCPTVAWAQSPDAPFSYETVQRQASELASSAYKAPPTDLPKGLEALDYDQYRQIRVRKEQTIWRGEGLKFEMQVLPTGWLFKSPVQISVVEQGAERALTPDNAYFDLGPLAGKIPPEARLDFSGFRIVGNLNRPDILDEIIVFQGASYFRALSRGQIYGLSARGLALNVGTQAGEEFPVFRKFWIEKPAAGASQLVIHALLDSPSVAGAYSFRLNPGSPTAIDVDVTLYPRKDLPEVGIAPLTSMFLLSGVNRSRISDFRADVHDSDGLAILNGWSEQVWRPLNNPLRLQTSDFMDMNPRGFGLIQRTRSFAQYQDMEARYELRPSAWIEPKGDWGPGSVRLFEIPSEEEIHDNIVAFWKPAHPLAAGQAHNFRYGITWPNDIQLRWPGAIVESTRSGLINNPQRKNGVMQFAVDFKGYAPIDDDLPVAMIEASAGAVGQPTVQLNPHIHGLRASFSFDPKGAKSSELRLVLQKRNKPVSETWLFRWTKD